MANQNHSSQLEFEQRKASSGSSLSLDSLSKTMMTTIRPQVELEKQTKVRFVALESKFESLEATIESRFTSMMNMLQRGETQCDGKAIDPGATQSFVEPNTQVRHSNSEPGHSTRNRDPRLRNSSLANRDSLLKKIEMPIFEGVDTYGWIVKVERYFCLGGYTEDEKMEMVSVSLEGAVSSWFNSEIRIRPFLDWRDLKERLLVRFTRGKIRDPSQPLCALKQSGSIADYVHEFEDLSS